MPVRKFRAIDDVPPAEAGRPGEDGFRAALDLSALCHWLHPWPAPRGVFRNTSIEEAQARRSRWEEVAPAYPPVGRA